jgi:hypothetical protein
LQAWDNAVYDWFYDPFADADKRRPVSPFKLKVAQKLVWAGTGGTGRDLDAVANELARLPLYILEYANAKEIKVVVIRSSVSEYLPGLKGRRPRGWPPGTTFEDVAGLESDRTAYLRMIDGRIDNQGSVNAPAHELFHAIDEARSGSADPDFVKAYDADLPTLDEYFRQAGGAGREEAYAESGAAYSLQNQPWAARHPNLWAFWKDHVHDLRE